MKYRSEDHVTRSGLITSIGRELGKELGSRSFVQTQVGRMADRGSRQGKPCLLSTLNVGGRLTKYNAVFLRHQRLGSAVGTTHAQAWDVQCHHRPQRILLARVLRFREQSQDVQADDADVCLGGSGGVQWTAYCLSPVATLGRDEEGLRRLQQVSCSHVQDFRVKED